MKRRIGCLIATAAVSSAALLAAQTARATPAASATIESTPNDVILSFDPKGGAVGWDIGVMRWLDERMDYAKIGRVLFTGASSGSIGAAFMACRGWSSESVAEMRQFEQAFDPAVLGEDTGKKAIDMVLGLPNTRSLKVLDRIVDIVTKNRTCVPKAAFAVAVTNHDVLHDKGATVLAPARSKTLDTRTFDVTDKATGKPLGKACTYFATREAASILRNVPASERLCDLRLITTPEDLVLAIHASVAEPTYFPPVVDPNPERFLDRETPASGRAYAGGFILLNVAQDIKRVMPETTVIGTGRALAPRSVNRFVKNWYLLDLNAMMMRQSFWYDWRAELSFKEYSHFDNNVVSVAEGAERALKGIKRCEAANKCRATFIITPEVTTDIDGNDLTTKVDRGIKHLFR